MRKVYFSRIGGMVDCNIYERKYLLSNNVIEGPAIVEEIDSTTVIVPGYGGKVDEFGNLIISKI